MGWRRAVSSPSPAASTGPTSTRWPRSPGARRTRWWHCSPRGPLTATVMGFSPGFAYLEGLPSPLDRVPRRPRPRPAVPAGSVADRQRPRRRLSHGVARRLAPDRTHRLSLVLRGGPALRRAGAGRPGPLHRGRRGRPRRTRAGGAAGVVPAAGRPHRLRGRGAGPAGRRAGRRAAGRRRGRCPGRRPGRPGVVRPGQPAGGERGAGGHARAHGGRDAAALPRRVPRGGGRRRARGPRRRQPGAGRTTPALGRGPGARRRSPARRMPQLPVGGRRVPRARVVREQRQRRADRARRRPADRGGRAACRCVDATARGPPLGGLGHRRRHLVAGGAARRPRPARRAVRRRRAGAARRGGLRGGAGVEPGRPPPPGGAGCARAAERAAAGEGSTPRAS